MKAIEAEEFLEWVWGERKGWVDLPAKVGAYWVPWHYKWEGEATNAVTRRIDTCLRDGENLYFSVGQFREKGREYENFMATSWLWADLDEVDPRDAGRAGFMPSAAWQSSPGRYQALWRLDRRVGAEAHERLNQALSYFLGADRGGWDLTQVLRVPGTRNFKYDGAPLVELLWLHKNTVYDPREIWRRVRGSALAGTDAERHADRLPRRSMPARARALLRVPADAVVDGERSARLWEIECLLAESGWGEEEIYDVVESSAWNKWASVRTGAERLRREIRKAVRHVSLKRTGSASGTESDGTAGSSDHSEPSGAESDDSESGTESASPTLVSPFVRYASFMAMQMEAPRWMIEGIWTQGSHGIIGGEPKTSKSTLALAMAISVASGEPFLGRYPVHVQGPVLMVQEENAPWMMQDRMRKIARSYGLISGKEISSSRSEAGSIASTNVSLEFPSEIPFRLLNNYGFDLSDTDHRGMLEEEVRSVRPVLVILDPLYLILGGVDQDRAKDLYPFLKWLLNLRYEYDCGIMLVHHFRKPSMGGGSTNGSGGGPIRSGQRILGSTTLHGWSDSAMYLGMVDQGQGWVKVRAEREFRSMAPMKDWEIRLEMGKPGGLGFDAEVREYDAGGELLEMVRGEPGVTVRELGERLGVDARTVLSRARGTGEVKVEVVKVGRGKSYRLFLDSGSENGARSDAGGTE